MELFSLICIAICGLIFGSFLAMLVYRLPLGISLFSPRRSLCPNCKTQLLWYENIPFFSYLYLQGKCSYCNKTISFFYPTIEVLTAIITLLLFLKIGLGYQFFLLLILFYSLLVLSFIDFQYKAVPDYLLLVSLVVSFIYILQFKSENIAPFFLFAGGVVILEFFVSFYIQNIKSKILHDKSLENQKALGEGDIPIFAIIGGVLGLQLGIFAIFLSALLAIIPSVFNSIIKNDKELPFIPFLALGFTITFFNESYILKILESIYSK